MLRYLLPLLLLATPLRAGVPEAVATIGAGYDRFAAASSALADAATKGCDPAALVAPYGAALDAWMAVQNVRLGPAEAEGRALAILYWPDPKGLGRRAQMPLIGDDRIADPAFLAAQSVAARGFPGLERLLWPDGDLPGDPCPLIRATAADLARLGAELAADWPAEAALLLTAGEPGNATFLAPAEARQALFTQLVTGLEVLADQRLGRPMGTFDRPRPDLAEARAAGRSLANVAAALSGMQAQAAALAPEATGTQAAFDRALGLAARLDDPVFAGVTTPAGRLKVEILHQAVRETRAAALAEIGAALGVGLGFNSQDGD